MNVTIPMRVLKGFIFAILISGCGGGGGGASGGSGGSTNNPPPGGQSPTLQANAPTQVAFGDTLTFTVTATNAGANPPPFEVLYGPAGMSVSSTGQVSWRAVLPMFSQSTDVSYAIGMGNAKLARTTTVVDPARKVPHTITGHQFPQQAGGMLMGDLRDEGRLNLLIAGKFAVAEYGWDGTQYTEEWSRAFTTDLFGDGLAIAVADVAGDAAQEIFVSVEGKVVRLDGATREPNGEIQLQDQDRCVRLIAADLDLDGEVELVCMLLVKGYVITTEVGSNMRDVTAVAVFDAERMELKWRSEESTRGESAVTGLAVGNVDSDAALEIVTAWGEVIDGGSFESEWLRDDRFGYEVAVGDLTVDGVAEIVGSGDVVAATVFSAVTKSIVATITVPSDSAADQTLVSDVDGDGAAELLIADSEDQSVIHLYRYDSGTFTHVTSLDAGGYLVSALAVGDIDDDGVPELVWGTDIGSSLQDKLMVAHMAGTPALEWSSGDSLINPPFFGGQSVRVAQGGEQLVFGAAGDTSFGQPLSRLIALDPDSGAKSVVATFPSVASGFGKFGMTVGDFDSDGIDEVVHTTGDSYDGLLHMFDTSARVAEWDSSAVSSTLGESPVVATADLNGDSFLDIVDLVWSSPGGTRLRILDVRNGIAWESDALSGFPLDLAIAKGANGNPTILAVTTQEQLLAFTASAAGGYEQTASRELPGVVDIITADLTNDGVDEVYYLIGPGDALNPTKLGTLDQSLSTIVELRLPSHQGLAIAAEAFPGADAPRNIVLSTFDLSGAVPSRLIALDPRTGDEVWRSPSLVDAPGPGSLFFFGTPDRPRISFGGVASMYVTN